MSNVVSFSGRSVNMDDSPVAEISGMTAERQRELLMASGLGKMVLLSGDDVAEFAFPPKKSPPPMPPPGAAPAMPPAPSPPQQKAPHVAIHVHAPGGNNQDPNAPPMGGPPMPGDPSMMPPMDEQPAEEDKTPQIEAFLETLPPEITIDDLQQYFENMEPVDDEAEEGDEEDAGPPKFSMTALEMFSAQKKTAEFGGPGSGRYPKGSSGEGGMNHPEYHSTLESTSQAKRTAELISAKAENSGLKGTHEKAAAAHRNAAAASRAMAKVDIMRNAKQHEKNAKHHEKVAKEHDYKASHTGVLGKVKGMLGFNEVI